MRGASEGVQGPGSSLEPPSPGQAWLGGGGGRRKRRGRIYLLGFCFPGCLSIQGPKVTRGPEGGSLTVECRYQQGWESHRKWWCRGAGWYGCQTLIETAPWQPTVQGPRLSISDNQRERVISVTMRDLRRDDQDTYWCGIRRFGPDRGVPVHVVVGGPGENVLVATPRPGGLGLPEQGRLPLLPGAAGRGLSSRKSLRESEGEAGRWTDG